jgi:hypothetical protein
MSPSWESTSSTSTQELLDILWNPKDPSTQWSHPVVPLVCQINPVSTTSSCLSKTNSNIIQPLSLGSSKRYLPFWLFPNSLFVFLFFLIRATRPAHWNLLLGEESRLWYPSWRCFLRPPLTSPRFSPSAPLSSLLSCSLSLCASLNAKYYVSCPFRTTCKIIV